MVVVLLIVSLLPVFLLGLYIYKKDSAKEPKSLLIGLFASGFLAALVTIAISILFMVVMPDFYLSENYSDFNFITLFILIFSQIALVEEFSKWIMIRNLGYNNRDFDQIYDIIVYSVFVGLGFAAIENLFYVFDGGVFLGIYRGVFSVPGHASFGVLMGYFLGLAKLASLNNNKSLYIKNMILSIFVPAFCHTVFNFCLMTGSVYFLLVFLGFVIILYVIAILKINQFSDIGFKNN